MILLAYPCLFENKHCSSFVLFLQLCIFSVAEERIKFFSYIKLGFRYQNCFPGQVPYVNWPIYNLSPMGHATCLHEIENSTKIRVPEPAPVFLQHSSTLLVLSYYLPQLWVFYLSSSICFHSEILVC